MIKRTLYFGNPVYIKYGNGQLLLEFNENALLPSNKSVPVEDIGIVILDHPQITITQTAIVSLIANNAAFITCDESHLPIAMLLNLAGNSLQTVKHKMQINASEPLKKQLWQQTVMAKIMNQATLLRKQGENEKYLLKLYDTVKSGDAENHEAKAAAHYWKRVFPTFLDFRRERNGPPPNNLLNYGYAILRACTARALVGSGLLPTLGIFHRNQYNAYCLADDIMEPYRPFVDQLVCEIIRSNGKFLEMGSQFKKELLSLPAIDVKIDGKKSPLLNAISRTTSSLASCFERNSRKILYPVFN